MEIRSFTELGAPKLSEGRIIEGYAVVFGKESRVMYDEERKRFFIEVIEHGAATEELITRCDIKAVYIKLVGESAADFRGILKADGIIIFCAVVVVGIIGAVVGTDIIGFIF